MLWCDRRIAIRFTNDECDDNIKLSRKTNDNEVEMMRFVDHYDDGDFLSSYSEMLQQKRQQTPQSTTTPKVPVLKLKVVPGSGEATSVSLETR